MSDLAATKTSPVWDYFSYDESAKKANVTLQLCECLKHYKTFFFFTWCMLEN